MIRFYLVAQSHGGRPIVHHDEASPGQGIAQVDHFGAVEPLVVDSQGQQRRRTGLAVRDAVDLGDGGSFGRRVAHCIAQRLIGEPRLGLDGRIQHLREKQRSVEAGPTLWSECYEQRQQRPHNHQELKQPGRSLV